MSRTLRTRTRYRIVGSDYSAQEPRMTAYLADQFANEIDPTTGQPVGNKMKDAYLEGKDLYAMIAQSAFNNRYEDNLEFYPEGTELDIDGKKIIAGKKTHKNPEGKARRSIGKVLNLASTYGMGPATAAARLNKTKEEGELLLNNFFNSFKATKLAIDYSKNFLKKYGYVEDFQGRRRHLPEINLKAYEVRYVDKVTEIEGTFNPFFGCADRNLSDQITTTWYKIINAFVRENNEFRRSKDPTWINSDEMSNKTFMKLQKLALNPKAIKDTIWNENAKGKKYTYEEKIKQALRDTAFKLPLEPRLLVANTGRRAQAERQCFNARIQGGAATLTKLAMIDISKDKILNDCQAKLIIPVHDELLVECPAFYADTVEQRLPQVMIDAAKHGGITEIPQSCDPYNVTRWYVDELSAVILENFDKLTKTKGLSHDEAIKVICEEHNEIPAEAIKYSIENNVDLDF